MGRTPRIMKEGFKRFNDGEFIATLFFGLGFGFYAPL